MPAPAEEGDHRNKILAFLHAVGELPFTDSLIHQLLIIPFLALVPRDAGKHMLIPCPKHRLRSDGRQIVTFGDSEMENHTFVFVWVVSGKFSKAFAYGQCFVAKHIYIVQDTNGVMTFHKA